MTKPTTSQSRSETRLAQVLDEYLAAIQAGAPFDRSEFLAAHGDLGEDLEACLASLDFLRAASPVDLGGVGPSRDLLGDFVIVRELGRGGMGVVYEARQPSLDRRVALKVLLAGRFAPADDLRRFRIEAEAAAQLDHANIVPIYEVGEHAGLPYFSMKLLDGGSLADRIAESGNDHPASGICPEEAARLVASIARAVHHAHQRGILHRDLKPSNILLTADGEPHITDFGLARRVAADSTLTQTGDLLGSPAYMAPEQASGKRSTITVATDVYGLGAIFYTLLTRQPPYSGDSALETLARVKEATPTPPSRFVPKLDRDLETICLKCLDKDPQRRYGSALELAEDLDRWLEGRPIQARRVGFLERAWRWGRRNPAVAALSALAVLLVLGGVIGLAVSNAVIRRSHATVSAKNAALERERQRADANAAFLLQGLTEALKRLANPALAEHAECRESALAALREGEATYLDLINSERRAGLSPARESAYWVHVALLRTAAMNRGGTLDAYGRAIGLAHAAESSEDGTPAPLTNAAGARMHLGLQLWVWGERPEASEQLRLAAVGFAHALERHPDDEGWQRNAVWFYLFCPVPTLRKNSLALELAQRYYDRNKAEHRDRPRFSEGIRPLFMLALAQYRAGYWEQARSTIEKSVRLKAAQLPEGTLERLLEKDIVIDAYDWFVWSMALARVGESRLAEARFNEAATWMRRNRFGDFELHLLRDEAEALLPRTVDSGLVPFHVDRTAPGRPGRQGNPRTSKDEDHQPQTAPACARPPLILEARTHPNAWE